MRIIYFVWALLAANAATGYAAEGARDANAEGARLRVELQTLLEKKDYARSEQLLREFFHAHPSGPQNGDLLLQWMYASFRNEDMAGAYTRCLHIVVEYPDSTASQKAASLLPAVESEFQKSLQQSPKRELSALKFDYLPKPHDSWVEGLVAMWRAKEALNRPTATDPNREYARAAKCFEAVIESGPKGPMTAKAIQKRALALALMTKIDDAVAELDRLPKLLPGDPNSTAESVAFAKGALHVRVAEALKADAKSAAVAAGRAVDALEACMKRYPDSPLLPRAMYHRSMAWVYAQQVDKAAASVDEMRKRSPSHYLCGDALVALGGLYVRRARSNDDSNRSPTERERDWREAARCFLLVVKEYANHQAVPRCHLAAATSHDEAGDFAKAVELYEQVVARDRAARYGRDVVGDALLLLAISCMNTSKKMSSAGDKEGAVALIAKALRAKQRREKELGMSMGSGWSHFFLDQDDVWLDLHAKALKLVETGAATLPSSAPANAPAK